ncbi:MAG: O-methyltransferase [Cytophagaceae bacterium]|nr:O-methyltransferase [Cytophagaceae bacterium]
MDFLNKDILSYIENHSSPESEVLKKLNRETNANVLMPRMLSGHFQGRVLSMISHMLRPKNILEIGAFTGYSAICLAEGLAKDGKLITIDINEELESLVLKYIREAGMEDKINLKIGNALEIIPELQTEFDLVFIDADKINYLQYYNMVFDKVRKGGVIIADNVLWSGKVAEATQKIDKDTNAIMEFNDFVQQDKRIENVLLPIRDGLMIVRKL